MTHLSPTEIINQLECNKSLTFFQNENSIVFTEPKHNYQRKLSPWHPKRRYSKSIRLEKKNTEEEESEKTGEFLRKIFPHRRSKSIKVNNSETRQTGPFNKQMTQSQRKITEEEVSFIYLPIKSINLQKLSSKKAVKQKERESIKQQSPQKTILHSIQPIIQIKQEFSDENLKQISKPTPMSVTFRRSWRKNHRCKTQPFESNKTIHKKISIDEMYRLIGKQEIQYKTQYGGSLTSINEFGPKTVKKSSTSLQKIPWLVSRSLKNNKFIKNKALTCKIQQI